MQFNSIDSFYKQMKDDLIKIAFSEFLGCIDIAKQDIYDRWYGKYPNGLNPNAPNTYDRLYLMADSLTLDYKDNGSELIFIIKPREDTHPVSNSWTGKRTYDDLLNWYENAYKEKGILDNLEETMFETGRVINNIISRMKSKGYKIQ